MMLLLLLLSQLTPASACLSSPSKAYIAIFARDMPQHFPQRHLKRGQPLASFIPTVMQVVEEKELMVCSPSNSEKAKAEDIVQRARNRFNIVLPRAVEFVFLTRRNFVEAKTYPVLTLLGQSLGSVVLGFEALSKFVPDIYIDSMGYAFTLPLFKYVGGCKVACYTHYPTISLDMLSLVSKRTVSYNNQGFVAHNPILSRFKVLYYKLFALLYGFVGARADVVMVNSSWTYGHISSLWGKPSCTSVVYPPCDTKEFLSIKGIPDDEKTVKSIVSIAQFRPEKDHKLQIRSFANFLKRLSESEKEEVKLELIGSCRNAEDQSRVDELKALSEELGVNERVDFLLSVPFDVLKIA
ncbi:putative GDP-Man:Man(3)GlcNAc(2)-PP-Dol alpha-1,2-mannosyltransferase isoform X2 [Apostichopus japonicus]|uniref:GDP-Man:Man(3)GlcNAc(2)-PP-Dol alpha-1,2-mannosyltransferase n=1 Tax=Stichopus japonicus TaxID=307972 RepID=A0A2G8K8Q9_STIJA|nr:putative GDP-Man:Man(3)GlcNAc(2)-PP-Dol alpha-1,2-mannosyltransferase isoform X2 [Apostichopus japonicus]